jgi:hypothetical protein
MGFFSECMICILMALWKFRRGLFELFVVCYTGPTPHLCLRKMGFFQASIQKISFFKVSPLFSLSFLTESPQIFRIKNSWFRFRFQVACRQNYKHFYLNWWEKHFVFENISVSYMQIALRKLISWYATHFLFQKACHDIFIVRKNRGKNIFESH